MKIIHCADLHLNSKMQTNLSPERARERGMELVMTFSRMVDYAIENGVSAILLSGDVFDESYVPPAMMNMFISKITGASEISFFYLSGNHDEKTAFSSVKVPPNLKFFGDEWTTYNSGPIAISGSTLKGGARERLAQLQLNGKKFNVVMLHGEVRSSGNGAIPLELLAGKGIDYLAMGHIHSPSHGVIDSRGIFAYSGCLEGRGFDECGERGFILLNIEDSFSLSFVPFAYRTFREVQVDISSCTTFFELENAINSQISAYPQTDALKIKLVGTFRLGLEKHTIILEKRLSERYYLVRIEDNSTLRMNINDYKNDKSIRGEFVRCVLSDETLTDEKKNRIIMLGVRALEGQL